MALVEIALVGNPNLFKVWESEQEPYAYETPVPSGGWTVHPLTLPKALYRAMARKTPIEVQINRVPYTFNGEHISFFRVVEG